jgi:RNA polymerase II subunit A small phosphatase-like protein
MEKKLLVLDLDETLLYASPAPLERRPDAEIPPYFVYKRPHLDEFLAFCAREFAVAVWTSASADYAQAVIAALFPAGYPLAFVFSRERCTWHVDQQSGEESWIKDLKKLKRRGYELGRVVFVEDSPANLSRQYGNVVPVTPFVGDAGDSELPRLAGYLGSLRDVADVRRCEKRNWRRPK